MKISLLPCFHALLFSAVSLAADPGKPAVTAKYIESCGCDVVCPCLFGGSPSNAECLGQGLYIIEDGSIDGVDLAGVAIHVAFRMGDWEMYTISKTASPEQFMAAKKLIKEALNAPEVTLEGVSQGWIKYDLSMERVSFETAESELVMEMVAGADGKPIHITNHPLFPDYRQYRSVVSRHTCEIREFSMKGTNAFTAMKYVHPD